MSRVSWPVFTPDGMPLHVRPATAADRPALAEMLTRCTELTRARRFLAPLRSFPERYLTEALQECDEHLALVAATPSAVVALASCRAQPVESAELAVLVEDAYQRQGIGACLLTMLIEHAERNGLWTLKASVLAEQAWIVQALRAYGRSTATLDMGVLEVILQREPRHASSRGITAATARPMGVPNPPAETATQSSPAAW